MSRQKVAPGAPPIPREEPTVGGELFLPSQPSTTNAAPIGRRTIKVTWGEENYHPVAFNGFKCGGIELVVDVAPNQTIEEAYDLAYGRLEAIAAKQFTSKLDGFIQRLRTAGQAVKVSAATGKGQ